MQRIITCISLIITCYACKTPGSIFTKKTGHEAYTDKLQSLGLQQTALGNKWLTAASKALTSPVAVQLPYKENGYFPADKPEAAAWSFDTKRGEQIIVELSKIPASNYLLFGDLFLMTNGVLKYVQSVDSLTGKLKYTAKENAHYILRLQPELVQSGSYTITIKAGPSLAFPISNPGLKNKVISIWGVGRDAGARKHEGIDIGGSFRTPVVAIGDGYVSSVSQNNLGGKVVFVRSTETGDNWYYAHLDSQIAYTGQRVSAGDVVGLMGNTGNAKNTVTHLHFGIYTGSGAIDPLPFVNPNNQPPKTVTANVSVLGNQYRINKKSSKIYSSPDISLTEKLSKNLPVRLLAATANLYKIILPDNSIKFIAATDVEPVDKIIKAITIQTPTSLNEQPSTTSPTIASLNSGTKVDLLGNYNGFSFVRSGNSLGWIRE